jgi:PAS domain-containing protein
LTVRTPPLQLVSTARPDQLSLKRVALGLSVVIGDVESFFDFTSSTAATGQAFMFWAAIVVAVIFLGLLGFVIGTLLSEGRQQAAVLQALRATASVLTSVAFMPAVSLMLLVFKSCADIPSLGFQCGGNWHWVLIALVVVVLCLFSAVSVFISAVYIDHDLRSTVLGAKVTGRLDATMLVCKILLAVAFTVLSRDPTLCLLVTVLSASLWILGVLFWQPYVLPLANHLVAAAAAFMAWQTVCSVIALLVPGSDVLFVMVTGIVVGPLLGALASHAYVSWIAATNFSSLRNVLQADIWARTRVSLAMRLTNNSQSGTGASRHAHEGGVSRPGAAMKPAPSEREGRFNSFAARASSSANLLRVGKHGSRQSVRSVQPLGNGSEGSAQQPVRSGPVTTEVLLPGVTAEDLIEQSRAAYDEMLKLWPKAAVTFSGASLFHRAFGTTVSSELTVLSMARKQVSAWDVAFLAYQRTRQLQERSGSGLSAMDRILFEEAWQSAADDAVQCFSLMHKLWSHAVETSCDMAVMGGLAEQLYLARTRASKRFQAMLSINPDSIMALRAYARFCAEVLGDLERATELDNKADRIEDKHTRTEIKPVELVCIGAREESLSAMNEHNAVVTMTGELRRYGEITDANVVASRLFGRARSDMIGQSLATLFPEPLGNVYDTAVLDYLSPHTRNDSLGHAHLSVAITAGGWLKPVRISVQESAGSELDSTPCISMVLQPAPSRRGIFLVGNSEQGFPVLGLDSSSYDLLGEVVHMAIADLTRASGRGDDESTPTSWKLRQADIQLLRWFPSLLRLAEMALASSGGIRAEIPVVHSSLNARVEEAERKIRATTEASSASSDQGKTVRMVEEVGTDSEVDSASIDGLFAPMGRNSDASLKPTGDSLFLDVTMQAIHDGVLVPGSVSSGSPSHWLVTWEPSSTLMFHMTELGRAGHAVVGFPSTSTTKQGSKRRRNSAASKSSRTIAPSNGIVTAFNVLHVANAMRHPKRPSKSRSKGRGTVLEDDVAAEDDGGQHSSVAGIADARGSESKVAPESEELVQGGGVRRPTDQDSVDGVDDDEQRRAEVMSTSSSTVSATVVTKRIVDTALIRQDPNISRVFFVVFAALVAVIFVGIGVAIAAPATATHIGQLLDLTLLGQKREFSSDVALSLCHRMVAYNMGLGERVDQWSVLQSNMTRSLQRMEQFHRDLTLLAQNVHGVSSDYEQKRVWDMVTEISPSGETLAQERMSMTDIAEFLLFHLKAVASSTPSTYFAWDDQPSHRYHLMHSASVLLPNIELALTAMNEAEHAATDALVHGIKQSMATQQIVFVACAAMMFVLATIVTTCLVGRIDGRRRALLTSIASIPRQDLRSLAKHTEIAQAMYTKAIGADSGEEILMDEGADLESGVRRKRRNSAAATAEEHGRGGGDYHGYGSEVRVVGERRCCRWCSSSQHDGSNRKRRVVDTSCFVARSSLSITSPLMLVGAWIAILLLMLSRSFDNVILDVSRNAELHEIIESATAMRSTLTQALTSRGETRRVYLEETITNSTKGLEHTGLLLNGNQESEFGIAIPPLAMTPDPASKLLFDVLVYDCCLAIPQTHMVYRERCTALQRRYELSGLHSMLTAMLNDAKLTRAPFNASNSEDLRTLPDLLQSGALNSSLASFARYVEKADIVQLLAEFLMDRIQLSAATRFDNEWGVIQITVGMFTAFFLLVVWLWIFPAIQRIESLRRSLFTLVLSLPEDVVLSVPAVLDVVVEVANSFGMSQAGRLLQAMSKTRTVRKHPSKKVRILDRPQVAESDDEAVGSVAAVGGGSS